MSLLAILALASVLAHASEAGASATSSAATISYRGSNATIANPERGFYHHTGDCDKKDFVASKLAGYRTTEKVTLVMCIFYLAEFKTSPISQAQLDRFDRQAAAVRAAGLKMVVRFAYTSSEAGDDAPLSRVNAHLDQLAPHLRSNSDVIDVVQSGFVGAWGEGYYSQNFGNSGVISPADWANRKAIIDKLLNVLPATRMVQVRTPRMKRQMFGTTPVSTAGAYNGSAVARIGHHNDCFLASSTDYGTYQNASVEYPYLTADTKYVAMGGETCKVNPPRSECTTALQELSMFHYSYLNIDYKSAVLESWVAGGCRTTIDQRLGYRLSLVDARFPTTVRPGTSMPIQIRIRNTGWSAPHNPRLVYLVLRNISTGQLFKVRISSDPRRWQAGTTSTIAQSLAIPASIPAGTYTLLLNLPDPITKLGKKSAYSIQLANAGVWEESTGFNRLLTTIEAH